MRSALGIILAAAATVVTSAAFAADHYDKEGTEIVLNRAARQVQGNCGLAKGEDGKATGPWGKTTVTITLGHNGHTRPGSVTIAEPFAGTPAGNCAVKAFSNLTFAPWTGQDETLEWPVELVKPEKGK